jgi:hypothetical protein
MRQNRAEKYLTTITIYLHIPVPPTWSIRHSRNASLQFSFLIFRQSVGHLGRGISPSQGRYLHTEQHKHTQTSMPWMGFEPTIKAFERAKTVHALDRAALLLHVVNYHYVCRNASEFKWIIIFHSRISGHKFRTTDTEGQGDSGLTALAHRTTDGAPKLFACVGDPAMTNCLLFS